MPKAYEEMRDKFMSQGLSEQEAKGKAARIYNSTHHSNPVTRKKHGKKSKKRHNPFHGVGR